jgi:hypothetical protein
MKDLPPWKGPARTSPVVGQGAFPVMGQVFVNMNTNSSITGWLLEHGANPNITNHQGRTPLELLCEPHSWRFYSPQEVTNRVALLVKAAARASSLSKEGEAVLREVVGDGKPPGAIPEPKR